VAKQGKTIQARPPWWMWVVSGVVGCAIGLWLVPPTARDRQTLTRTGAAVSVGTTGRQAKAPQPSVIREIETITGANDGMALVGRCVDLHVDVHERANDVAFWVGPRDNRVLVVVPHDSQNTRLRRQADPASHRIAPVHDGERAVIGGVIRPSTAEDVEGWTLTEVDRAELNDRKIYIRADAVASEAERHF